MAKRIISAYAEALSKGQGVAVLDGTLVENLHAESAKHTVAMAEAIAQRAAR
jgi:citrate lyase beta subunit